MHFTETDHVVTLAAVSIVAVCSCFLGGLLGVTATLAHWIYGLIVLAALLWVSLVLRGLLK